MSHSDGEDHSRNDPGLRLRMRGEERRISSQHKQLGDLFDLILTSVDGGGPRRAIGDFLLFEAALEAHMSLEEDIYFPALHGLRNDLENELTDLVAEHRDIRIQLRDVKKALEGTHHDVARQALHSIAERIDKHEEQEENLLARITEGPLLRFGHTSLEDV